jgi:hypothetical protein
MRGAILVVVSTLACATSVRAPATAPAPEVLGVTLAGTRIVVHKPDGSVATDDELVGAVLVSRVSGSGAQPVRIDEVQRDASDRSGEVYLYKFSVQGPDGAWRNACMPDAFGRSLGFPMAATIDDAGVVHPMTEGFEITCTSGALGKCVLFGYRPWRGAEMAAMHQACTRMVRADYCGDGHPHTKDGTKIDVFDRVGVQLDEPDPGMTFEAGWATDGAVCVAHTRVANVAVLADIEKECPQRLGKALGASCTEDVARADSRALLFDRSH